jgi:hypothetical protein
MLTPLPTRSIGPWSATVACVTAVVAFGRLHTVAEPARRPADVDIAAPAIAPTEVIALYDGKTVNDLRHFYTWLGGRGYQDPNGVFSIAADVDGAPAIRVTGQDYGGLVTRRNYRDYRLILEYRWSDKTWSQRARNSGVLFHAQGEDGNNRSDFKAPWLSSVEYEIQEGRTGAVILVPGFKQDGTPMQHSVRMRTKHHRIWNPDGEPQIFTNGFLFQSTYDSVWKDERGFCRKNDHDKPIGEWNRAEITAHAGDITYLLNGVKVLEAMDGSFTHGRIMFQSEGAEIFFRRIELHPLH